MATTIFSRGLIAAGAYLCQQEACRHFLDSMSIRGAISGVCQSSGLNLGASAYWGFVQSAPNCLVSCGVPTTGRPCLATLYGGRVGLMGDSDCIYNPKEAVRRTMTIVYF